MKKIMLSLLTISLIGTTVMPVYAADVEDEKLQKDFEAAINDGIGLSTDDFSETSYSANVDETMQSENEIESLEADFEAAMQDENIKLSEDGIETMNLISTADYNIDTEYAVEVNDYKSEPILTRAASTVSRVEYGQQWRIYRKSDNATMVQWVLRGLFLYNGKTSQCKQTSMSCYNNASNAFTVISKSLKLSFWKTRFWCWYI